MPATYLDFEAPLAELDARLRDLVDSGEAQAEVQIAKVREQFDKTVSKLHSGLSVWQKVQLARHPDRPHTIDYIGRIFSEFEELHGDRVQGNDAAILGGVARLEGKPVMVVGHERGRETTEKIERNFGMAHPEGLRKAGRLMRLAERFKMPVLFLVDTPGAYPGVEGEERNQAEAIAANLALIPRLRTPVVVSVIGEGGSGGALAIGIGDRMGMMEYSVFSVATPEACSSIVWRDQEHAADAAAAMKVSADELLELGLADEVVTEPLGGAHRDHAAAAECLGQFLQESLDRCVKTPIDDLLQQRYQRIMSYGRLL